MSQRKISKIAIFGTGGHAREVLCLIQDVGNFSQEELTSLMVFVTNEKGGPQSIHGVSVIEESKLDSNQYEIVIAIGDSIVRKKVFTKITSKFPTAKFATLIHPSVIISPWVTIGEGVIIFAGNVLTCDITVGKQVQFNRNCSIGHDCVIGDFVSTAPGVILSGGCTLGDSVYLGTNASVRQGVTIKENIMVGMGASVVGDLVEVGTYVGVPAKLLRRKS